MSKCRAKNPQKCYYHSAMGRFVFRLAKVKTQASDEQIKKTMSELNKEGKNLPAPNQQDVANWIDGRELATQFDPDLDKKEREIQMNYLKQAREDVTEGVSGARFHMWKNLVGRLKKNVGRKVAALAIGGALIVGLGACSSNGGTIQETAKPSSTSSASASPTKSAGVYGDSVDLREVTDKYGKYEQTTISPKASAMKLNDSVVTPGAKSTWSNQELTSAQQFVAKFVAEEGVDSTAVDNADAWDAWKTTNKKYFEDSQYASMMAANATGKDRPAVIGNDPKNVSGVAYNPVFSRDGKARVEDSSFKVTAVDGGTDQVGKYVDVKMKANVKYSLTNKEAMAYLKTINQDLIASDALKKDGNTTWKVEYDFYYRVAQSGDSWKITGFQNTWNGEGASNWLKVASPTETPAPTNK